MTAFRTTSMLLGLAAAAALFATGSANASEERTTSNLNLRTGPGMNYPVQRVIPAGSLVNVVACGHEWCHLTWAGHVGYSNASWLVSHVTVAVPIKHVK
jgi:uncharacterized protein YraI